MNSFFLRHVEKFLFLIILVACGYWASSSVATMSTSPTNDRELKDAIASIEDKLSGPATWSEEVASYLERVKGTQNPSVGPAPVPHHVFNWLPPGGKEGIIYLDGELEAPAEIAGVARRGQITITWSLANAKGCVPYQFELYRRKQGEDDFPDKPYATVKAGWPEPEFVTEKLLMQGVPRPGIPLAGKEAETPEKTIKKEYEYTDNNVDAKTTYYYRVRVWAEEFTKGQLQSGGWKALIRPNNVTVVERDGEFYWITGYSGMAETRTPSNIRLVYKGAFGNAPHWKARVTVKEWRSDLGKWIEVPSLASEGGRIVGEGTVNIKGRSKRVKIDSSHILVKIVKETRYREVVQEIMGEERIVQVPYIYNAIRVKDVETGDARNIEAGEEELDEDMGPAPAEAEEKEAVSGGGRRRRSID